MAGLQGSGKTTTAASWRSCCKEQKKKVLLVALRRLPPGRHRAVADAGGAAGGRFFPSALRAEARSRSRWPRVDYARTHYHDVLIVDTAGRLAIDEAMMQEIAALHAALKPVETLFVVDAMQGQDAVNVAQGLHERAAAHRRDPDQAGRRCARRRGAVGAPGHRQADQVRRRGREARRASSRSTPSAWPRASSAWATCCRWSRRRSKSVDLERGAEARGEGEDAARASTSRISRQQIGSRCARWAAWPR